MLKPLEKYVVNIIHWGEEIVDSDSLASTMSEYENLEAVLKKIKVRFRPELLLNWTYNEELTDVISKHSEKKSEIEQLKKLARDKSDSEILRQADKIEKETEKLKKEFSENKKILDYEVVEHEKTKKELEVIQKQVGVLQSKDNISIDNSIDAMHIMKTYADSIDSNIEEIMDIYRNGEEVDEVLPLLHEIRQTCSKIINTYNIVINTDYDADSGNKKNDIVKFTKVYTEKQWSHKLPISVEGIDSKYILFNPLEFSIIIDNIADNALKANASKLRIVFKEDNGFFCIHWIDDGYGLKEGVDKEKIFEQGFTTTKGTGIGLYTVNKYAKKMEAFVVVNEKYIDGFELEMRFKNGFDI